MVTKLTKPIAAKLLRILTNIINKENNTITIYKSIRHYGIEIQTQNKNILFSKIPSDIKNNFDVWAVNNNIFIESKRF